MQGKKHIILFALSVLMMLSSCKDKLTQFHISYDAEADQVAAAGGSVFSLATPEIRTDCRVRFERNNTKRSKVKRIHLSGLSFSADSTCNFRLSAFKLKGIYISSPNYAEKKISLSGSRIRKTEEKWTVQLSDSDLDVIDFIKQDRFSMRFDFENTSDFPENLKVNIDFFVEGELIKTNLYHKILV